MAGVPVPAKRAARAKEARAKTYAATVIGVNILYMALLLLGFSSSAASSQYDGSWPYDGTKFGLFGMLVTWLQQGYYTYLGIVANAASTATATKRSKGLVVGIHFYLLMATIVTQFFSLLYSQQWFYINIFGVPIVCILYKTLYYGKNDNKKKKKKKASAYVKLSKRKGACDMRIMVEM